MAREERIAKWVRRVLSDSVMTQDGARKCVALALMHVTSGIRSEVQALKLGAKVWDPIQLADMFDTIASEHAAGLASNESGSGQETYQLVAFYDDLPDTPVAPLPIMKRTGTIATSEDPIVTEPPTAKGELGQNMRERSSWMQFTLEMNARTFAAMAGVIDRLNNRLGVVEKENQDAFEMAKDVILEKAADSHDQRMKELAFERTSEERARIMKALPPLVNRVLGKEIFPQSAVDSTLMEGLLESLDADTLSRVIEIVLPKLKPEHATLLMGRFGDIQIAMNERKAAAAQAAAKANGNGAPKA